MKLAAELGTLTLQPIDDDLYGYCESADQYDDARLKLHAEFALRVARFTFAWSAFEILVKRLPLRDHPVFKNSAGKSATWTLKCSGISARACPGYLHLLQHSCGIAKDYWEFDGIELPPPDDRPHISEAGYGVELCRTLRNRLAHGRAALPPPQDWRQGELGDNALLGFINMLVKLLGISMQMLLIAHLPKTSKLLSEEDGMLFDVCGGDFSHHLHHLHLEGGISDDTAEK